MGNIRTNIPKVLLSILPISIIIGSSVSLLNTVLFSLCFLFIYFSKDKIKIYDLKPVLLLIILNFYLIFNSLISIDMMSGIFRNFGFVRFILFFVMVNYLFSINKNNLDFLKTWSIIFFIVLIDIYIERYSGSNIFGFGKIEIDGVPQPHGDRVTSFFRNEPIAGSFICGFSFIIFGYILNFLKSKKFLKVLGFIIILFSLFGIILTGERSNSLKAIIGIMIFVSIIDFVKLKQKILIFTVIIATFFFAINFSDYLKLRYIDQIYSNIKSEDKRKNFIDKNIYITLYKSGFYVFKNNPLFGVGNKNYRIETCDAKKNSIQKEYRCLTHPHQIYIEMLSEHGIVGTIIIISIIFFLIFRIMRKIIDSKNYVQAGCLVFILINFVPILPSGAFFNNYSLTLFMINFSLMYAVNKKTNIFSKKNDMNI